MKSERIVITLFSLWIAGTVSAQHISQIFDDIVVRVDTNVFSIREHQLLQNNTDYLYFYYDNPDEVCEVTLYPSGERDRDIEHIELVESGDFTIIDSILFINDSFYRFKVEFEDLNRSRFLKFLFNITDSASANPKPAHG